MAKRSCPETEMLHATANIEAAIRLSLFIIIRKYRFECQKALVKRDKRR